MTKLTNEIGNEYGRLEVIKRGSNSKKGQAMWICKCVCGNITEPISGSSLRNGASKSCSCYQKQRVGEMNKQRDMSGENNPMFGKKHSLETRKKISKTRIEKGVASGENNPNFGKRGMECGWAKHAQSYTKEYNCMRSHKHRALKLNAPGSYTIEDLKYIYNHQQGKCPCCRKFIPFEKMTVDHIIPLSWEGSTNYSSNIQLLCKSCNCGKRNHHNTDFRDYVPLFLN